MQETDLIYSLRPLLLPLLLPPTPPLLFALICGWYTWRRHRIAAIGLVLGLMLSWVCCSERVGEFLVSRLLDPPPPLPPAQVDRLAAQADPKRITAVLVLGGGVVEHAPEYGTTDLNDLSIERLRYGVWLARRMGAPLGFSGGVARGGDPARLSEAAIAKRIAADEFGVPLRWVETLSRNTGENASYSVQLLRRDKVERIVVVSHREHLPRVMRAFRSVAGDDLEIVAAGVDYRDASAPFTWGDWTPSWHGFRKVRSAVTEWLGWIVGR